MTAGALLTRIACAFLVDKGVQGATVIFTVVTGRLNACAVVEKVIQLLPLGNFHQPLAGAQGLGWLFGKGLGQRLGIGQQVLAVDHIQQQPQ